MLPRTVALAALALAFAPAPSAAQHPDTMAATVVEGADFRVYDHRGRSRSFADVLKALDGADAVLVGETHDDVVGHGVEAQIFIRAAQRMGAVGSGAETRRPVVLSLEMFERDVQYVVDEYLSDLITEDQFKRSARPWDRYDTDYRGMVEFAKAHGLPVVAANAPRRYVNRVSRQGPGALDALSAQAKAFLPPLPYPGPSEKYTAQWNALMAEMMAAQRPEGQAPPPEAAAGARPNHGIGNALYAQALWDAAMGHAVTSALDAWPGALVVHYAGSFHVERGTGIPERVAGYRPRTKVVTVVLQPVADIDAWDDEEHDDLGDFVILTKRPAADPTSGA
ncbi:MAG: hypothetical protein AMXMBFR53_25980 [Gemmatimonadota bacterium]